MKAAFEAHGFDELFEDPVKLESFLGTHRQAMGFATTAGSTGR